MLEQHLLLELYEQQRLSMQEIAVKLGCSVHKVVYWMDNYGIKRRSISDAVYLKNNPNGDPFRFSEPQTLEEAVLFGLGIGIYWGEGTKLNSMAVRMGNTDPALTRTFMDFLIRIFGVARPDFRFAIQIFSDLNPEIAMRFWTSQLRVHRNQFYKTRSTPSGSLGTYRRKSLHGVCTVHYNNKRLRDLLVGMCRDSSAGRARTW